MALTHHGGNKADDSVQGQKHSTVWEYIDSCNATKVPRQTEHLCGYHCLLLISANGFIFVVIWQFWMTKFFLKYQYNFLLKGEGGFLLLFFWGGGGFLSLGPQTSAFQKCNFHLWSILLAENIGPSWLVELKLRLAKQMKKLSITHFKIAYDVWGKFPQGLLV